MRTPLSTQHDSPTGVLRLSGPLAGVLVVATTLLAGTLLAALFTPPLLTVEAPAASQRVGLGGFELLVRFDPAGRAEPATFRALLNGADVTDRLEKAPNGAHGRLSGLLEGPNRLRLQVFGSRLWPPALLVEQTREIEILYRPPLDLDRA